jgi:hypothetical protein
LGRGSSKDSLVAPSGSSDNKRIILGRSVVVARRNEKGDVSKVFLR